MNEPWCAGLSTHQEGLIKRAVESTCELCREYTPLSLLQLHSLPPKRKHSDPTPKERERHILVVCEPCHRLIHAEPVGVKKLRARIASRTFNTRREILYALGFIPKSIIPPEDQDFARVYDETLKDISGHYR